MSDEADLRDRLLDGQVVVIAGAGVSLASVDAPPEGRENVASWIGLLRDGVAEAQGVDDHWRNLRLSQIETGDVGELVSAADRITDAMGGRKALGLWPVERVVAALRGDASGNSDRLGASF